MNNRHFFFKRYSFLLTCFLFTCFSFIVSNCNSQYRNADNIENKAVVDIRCELLSTVFRLAGNSEYISIFVPDYTSHIDKHFNRFKEYPVITMAKSLNANYNISHDAVMSLAVNLQITDDSIILIKGITKESIDSKWQKDSIEKFLLFLNDFYDKSKFRMFYNHMSEIVDTAENRFLKNANAINSRFFDIYFGYNPKRSFKTIISLTNGVNDYGVKINRKDNSEEIYSIIGTAENDMEGYPVFSQNVSSEIFYNYCEILLASSFKEYESGVLSDHNNYKDIIIKALEARYYAFLGADSENILEIIKSASPKNRSLMIKLDYALIYFEKNRKIYPSFDSYMPEIIKALQ